MSPPCSYCGRRRGLWAYGYDHWRIIVCDGYECVRRDNENRRKKRAASRTRAFTPPSQKQLTRHPSKKETDTAVSRFSGDGGS